MKRALAAGAVLALLLAGVAAVLRGPASVEDGARIRLVDAEPGGFARAIEPRSFSLPADHGPHFQYQTEWWYYTGQLTDGEGRRCGFQLTFFRRGLSPGAPADGPGLQTNQIYFAHLALSDVAGGEHRAEERFARGAGGLAGASGEPYRVWLEDWEVEAANDDGSRMRLRARGAGGALDLELAASKPLVLQGDRGLSAKSEEPGNASYYVSYTRLAATGILELGGERRDVEGAAWFDHEWSTSALGPGAVGWDWFSLQLDDERELMLFQIRREDGGIESVSSGTLVEPDGSTRRLLADDFEIEPLDFWTSPSSGARYPSRWRVRVPAAALQIEVTPLLADQELRTSFTYWEGAVDVAGEAAGQRLAGHGYVELTGYARSLQGVF